MSEKDKVKYIKITKSQRKLLLNERQESNELLSFVGQRLTKLINKLEKARIEDIAVELGIEEAFQDGEWAFDTKKNRFIKQNKTTPPPPPPEKPTDQKDPKKNIPNNKDN